MFFFLLLLFFIIHAPKVSWSINFEYFASICCIGCQCRVLQLKTH